MRKNRYDEVSKEYYVLTQREHELWQAKRALNYIPLDKPIHKGFTARLTLRDDIARRDDAWVYRGILDRFSFHVWCRNRTFKMKTYKGKYEDIFPGIRKINKDEYLNLSPQIKKHFTESLSKEDFGKNMYCCTVPAFYFVVKISKNYLTHYIEHNELIEQELAEVRDKIEEDKYLFLRAGWGYKWTAPHWYRNHKNRQKRLQHRREIHEFIRNNTYEVECNDKYSDSAWFW